MSLGKLFLEGLDLLFEWRSRIRSVREKYIDAVGWLQALQTMIHLLLDSSTAELAAAITHLTIHFVDDECTAEPTGLSEKLLCSAWVSGRVTRGCVQTINAELLQHLK